MSAIDEYRKQLRFLAGEVMGVLNLIVDVEKRLDAAKERLAKQKIETTEIYEKIDDILDLGDIKDGHT